VTGLSKKINLCVVLSGAKILLEVDHLNRQEIQSKENNITDILKDVWEQAASTLCWHCHIWQTHCRVYICKGMGICVVILQ